ncbi:MAG: PAS domain-containing protein [Proteobacteria bacterium]|nr:PAS domain-containing protein [Pseudomonadota bacterium]
MLTVESHSPAMSAKVLQAYNETSLARGWPFRCEPAENFVRPDLNDALAIWTKAAAGRPMPARADMTARLMKAFLPNMSLIEQIATDQGARYRVRLHGSTLARYSGDSTGKFLEDVVHDGRVDGYRALYDCFIAWRAPLRVISQYQAPEIAYLVGETLLAPLSVPASAMPLILSVTYTKPRIETSDYA